MSFTYQTDQPEPEADPSDDGQYREIAVPRPVYTIILSATIVVVAAVQFLTGLEASVLAVGFDKPAFSAGEFWRILTGAAVHGSPMHLLMNTYALYSFGRIVEMLSNRAHLAIVFLASAIGGGLLSLVFVPDGLSVGASGGIVGLISYLLVYAFRRRRFISAEFRKSLLINIGFILIFGLVLFQVVDNFGHIGGLIAGALYGLLQISPDEYADPLAASRPTTLLGLAALGVYLAGCVFSIALMFRSF